MNINIALSGSKPQLSEAQKEYRDFVKRKLKESGKKHPFEGEEDEVADFLIGLSDEWAKHKKENNIETKN